VTTQQLAAAPTRPTRRPAAVPALVVALALAVGLAVGVGTSYLQGVLPGAWNTAANSGAVWAAVGFAVAAYRPRRPAWAATAGALVLLGEVTGYYLIAAPVRDIATSRAEVLLWTIAALVLGPLAGLGGWLWHRGTARARVGAGAALCGTFGGEGAHLVRLAGAPAAGWVEIAAAAAAAFVLLLSNRRQLWPTALVVAALNAGLCYLAYAQPLPG
jgi:uncharacterized protein DUF6518